MKQITQTEPLLCSHQNAQTLAVHRLEKGFLGPCRILGWYKIKSLWLLNKANPSHSFSDQELSWAPRGPGRRDDLQLKHKQETIHQFLKSQTDSEHWKFGEEKVLWGAKIYNSIKTYSKTHFDIVLSQVFCLFVVLAWRISQLVPSVPIPSFLGLYSTHLGSWGSKYWHLTGGNCPLCRDAIKFLVPVNFILLKLYLNTLGNIFRFDIFLTLVQLT